MFHANSRRIVSVGPPVWLRPILTFRQGFIQRKPVRAFPAGFLTKACPQFLQATIHRAEAQLAGAAAFLRRIENIVIGAIDFMDAGRDVATAGWIRSEAANIHVPEIKARLSFDDPLREHLANSTRTRNAMGAKTACRPETSHIGRLTKDKFSIRRKRLKSIDSFDELSPLHSRNSLYTAFEQTLKAGRIKT